MATTSSSSSTSTSWKWRSWKLVGVAPNSAADASPHPARNGSSGSRLQEALAGKARRARQLLQQALGCAGVHALDASLRVGHDHVRLEVGVPALEVGQDDFATVRRGRQPPKTKAGVALVLARAVVRDPQQRPRRLHVGFVAEEASTSRRFTPRAA